MIRGYCVGCGENLLGVDDDPNGEHNITCVRCRAEEEHDFDAEPGVVFDRFGDRVEKDPQEEDSQ